MLFLSQVYLPEDHARPHPPGDGELGAVELVAVEMQQHSLLFLKKGPLSAVMPV
jgi:hypothetical protein